MSDDRTEQLDDGSTTMQEELEDSTMRIGEGDTMVPYDSDDTMADTMADIRSDTIVERDAATMAPHTRGAGTRAVDGPHEAQTAQSLEEKIQARIREAERTSRVPTDPFIGRLVADRFKVLKKLGAGGMGAVYLADQAGMDRRVAVKVLRRDVADDESIIKRFHLEALAVSKLMHPHTIRIFDFGEMDDGTLYIAMEFLEGDDLDKRLKKKGQLPIRLSLRILAQVCQSLREAHGKGIIHRDLKPENVYLINVDGDPNFVKVLDFGVAKIKEQTQVDGTVTKAGMVFGTPKYMSPEQCRAEQLDARSDIYSLGAMLYELITGRGPFIAETAVTLLLLHIQEQPAAMGEVRRDLLVPQPVEGLVLRCLEKDKNERFDSVEDLEKALWELHDRLDQRFDEVVSLDDISDATTRAELVRGPAVTFKISTETAMIQEQAPPPKKGHGGLVAVLVTLLVVGLGVGGYFIYLDRFQPRQVTPLQQVGAIDMGVLESRAPKVVQLAVLTEPTAAKVFEGDKELGIAPISLEGFVGEKRVVTIKAKDHQPWTGTIELDGTTSKTIVLEPIPKAKIPVPPPVKVVEPTKVPTTAKDKPPKTKPPKQKETFQKVKETKKDPYGGKGKVKDTKASPY